MIVFLITDDDYFRMKKAKIFGIFGLIFSKKSKNKHSILAYLDLVALFKDFEYFLIIIRLKNSLI